MTVPDALTDAVNDALPGAVTPTSATTPTTPPAPTTLTLEVRYFAAARAALGRASETLAVTPGSTVRDVVEQLARATPDAAPVLARCALLVYGRRVEGGSELHTDARLDLLPPFAGG